LKNQLFLVILFILFFASQAFGYDQPKEATNGILDYTSSATAGLKTLNLDGYWIYFPDTLIPPEHIQEALNTLPHSFIHVPSGRAETKNHPFGTYYLKLLLDSTSVRLTLQTLTIYSSASIYVNNQLIGSQGHPGSTVDKTQPELIFRSKEFQPELVNQIVVHYANFYREKTGIANRLVLTTRKHQLSQYTFQLIKYALILGTILFIIFNQINYFFIRRRSRTSLYFGLASITISIYIFFMGLYYSGLAFPDFNPDFFVALKTWRLAYYSTVCFFALYVYSLFPTIYPKKVLYFTIGYTSFSALLTLIAPLHISSINFNFFMLFTLLIALHGFLMGIIGSIRKIEDSGLFIFGFGFFMLTVINDILHNLLIVSSVNLLDLGIFGMMLTQAQIINSKLNRSIQKSDRLSQNLKFINNNLEQIVVKRTEEIEEQKAEIEAQRDYAETQHRLIATQKKTITDSINYAREIQQAVLPDEEILRNYFSDSFILFKPKDYVSGDFYWIRKIEINDIPFMIFCTADCTGHGVPGAMLSMLGMSLLSEIISYEPIEKASDILESLRLRFKETLANCNDKQATSDGMYLTLCMVNLVTNQLQYSGAFQSLLHITADRVNHIKGTRNIIGSYMHEVKFENNIIQLSKGDRLYLFTDGFADQMAENGQGRFMQKRLISFLSGFNGTPFVEQKQVLDREFEQWKGDFEQMDDVLVLGVKF